MQGRPRLLPASRPRAVSVGRAPGARPAEPVPKAPVPHGYRARDQCRPGSPRRCGCRSDRTQSWGRTQTRGASRHPRQQPRLVSAQHGARRRGRRHQGLHGHMPAWTRLLPYTSGPRTQAVALVRGRSPSPRRPGASLHLLTLTRLRNGPTASPSAHRDAFVPPSGGSPVTTRGQGTPWGSRRPARRAPTCCLTDGRRVNTPPCRVSAALLL